MGGGLTKISIISIIEGHSVVFERGLRPEGQVQLIERGQGWVEDILNPLAGLKIQPTPQLTIKVVLRPGSPESPSWLPQPRLP